VALGLLFLAGMGVVLFVILSGRRDPDRRAAEARARTWFVARHPDCRLQGMWVVATEPDRHVMQLFFQRNGNETIPPRAVVVIVPRDQADIRDLPDDEVRRYRFPMRR